MTASGSFACCRVVSCGDSSGRLTSLRKLAVFFVVVSARRTMLSVDIEGLEKLKYPNKGA